uniref:Uncharacterized protein n=1 Tax=Kalanchoe fedtschenkoi TaxID=63787 RepID=A0A7N0ULA1_KALFE
MQASSSRSSSLLSCSFSFPLCVSGITRRLALSSEMVDHERRRRAMKRRGSLGRADGSFVPSGDLRLRRLGVPSRGTVMGGDGEIRCEAGVGGGECRSCCCCLPCAAKAA